MVDLEEGVHLLSGIFRSILCRSGRSSFCLWVRKFWPLPSGFVPQVPLQVQHWIFMLEVPIPLWNKWTTGQDDRIGDQPAFFNFMLLFYCEKKRGQSKNLTIIRKERLSDGHAVPNDSLTLPNYSLTLLNDGRTVPKNHRNRTNCGRTLWSISLTIQSDGRALWNDDHEIP